MKTFNKWVSTVHSAFYLIPDYSACIYATAILLTFPFQFSKPECWQQFLVWEYFSSQALISIDPVRAREDPVVVKNVPYYKARKALEAEVMKLDPPPRPQNWGVSILYFPLSADSYFLSYVHLYSFIDDWK